MKSHDGQAEGALIVAVLVVLGALGLAALFWIFPNYNVWRQEMDGKGRYAEAMQSRQIKVLEAKAKLESARFEAEAEIERAKGVAKANKIIGESLSGNEAYLRYLWIQNLNTGEGERIYIPTEAGLPILEARK